MLLNRNAPNIVAVQRHEFLSGEHIVQLTLGSTARAMRVPLRPAPRGAPRVRATGEADVVQAFLKTFDDRSHTLDAMPFVILNSLAGDMTGSPLPT